MQVPKLWVKIWIPICNGKQALVTMATICLRTSGTPMDPSLILIFSTLPQALAIIIIVLHTLVLHWKLYCIYWVIHVMPPSHVGQYTLSDKLTNPSAQFPSAGVKKFVESPLCAYLLSSIWSFGTVEEWNSLVPDHKDLTTHNAESCSDTCNWVSNQMLLTHQAIQSGGENKCGTLCWCQIPVCDWIKYLEGCLIHWKNQCKTACLDVQLYTDHLSKPPIYCCTTGNLPEGKADEYSLHHDQPSNHKITFKWLKICQVHQEFFLSNFLSCSTTSKALNQTWHVPFHAKFEWRVIVYQYGLSYYVVHI